MDGLTLLSQRDNIEEAFKSLIKSGRPDIRDDENKNLLPQLYVDLFENDYFLKQALDGNHAIFKGRRGTGKSTIFLQAEEKLKEKKKRETSAPMQMDFTQVEKDTLINEIVNLDVLNMTPMDAMNTLYKLIKDAKSLN